MNKSKRIFATANILTDVYIVRENLKSAIQEFNLNDTIYAVVELNENNELLRYIITNAEVLNETCPLCGEESVMKPEFRLQHCTECGKILLPCGLCNHDLVKCSECPLDGRNGKFLAGINPKK